jgi:putative ABC transport system permease protein
MSEWSQHLRARLAGLRLSPTREAEIIEELSQHLDERCEELRGVGTSEAEARRLAMDELLTPDVLAECMRPLRQANVAHPIAPGAPGRRLVDDVWQDLRYAVRMLRNEPGFAMAAILTLALGIGANSAILALVDATLLRPLPFPEPDRLVRVWEQTEASPRGGVSVLNLHDWNQRNHTFEGMAAFVPNVGSMVLSGEDGSAETIPRQWVSAGIFDVLGVRAVIGRTFSPSDLSQRASVVVLAEAFWRTHFTADPTVVGRHIRLDGEPHVVVGVVPDQAQILGRSSMWALEYDRFPSTPGPGARSAYGANVIGRLRSGVTLEAAARDLAAIAKGLAQEFPSTNRGRGVALQPLHDVVIGAELRHTSLLFLGVVGFVLLICCANIASLLLARATVRKRELAVRSALGADRRRVIRQLLTESVTLAVIGGAIGLVVGAAILNIAPSVVPEELLPAIVKPALDLRVVAFCAATALLMGLLFGLVPAWQATAFSSAQAIASDSRTTTGRGGRTRELLVIGQVATAVVLLSGAGLLLRSLLAVESVDRGYRAESVLTMIVDPGPGYPTQTAVRQFYGAVEQEVTALPGVRGVAWATTLPMGRSYQGPFFFEIAGQPVAGAQRPTADYQIVSSAYFGTLDLPVVAGRGFDTRDAPDSLPVCIVNEAFVRRHLQGRSPIGVRVAMRPTRSAQGPAEVREIVGVARQVKGRATETEDLIQIYVPLAQNTPGDIFMLVRTSSAKAQALAPSVRAALHRVDRAHLVSVRNAMTLDDVARSGTARHRFRAVLVMAFAGLALVLAMVGLFGILAYSVQQRARDFGVRRALGATTSNVLTLVAGNATRVVAAGAVVGLALSTVVGRLVATMLFGVQPLDPLTFVSVVIILALTAAAAIAGPAWRATRIDPAVALRGE